MTWPFFDWLKNSLTEKEAKFIYNVALKTFEFEIPVLKLRCLHYSFVDEVFVVVHRFDCIKLSREGGKKDHSGLLFLGPKSHTNLRTEEESNNGQTLE